MKATKFTDAQKAFVIKQGEEGTPVAAFVRAGQMGAYRWTEAEDSLERFSISLDHSRTM